MLREKQTVLKALDEEITDTCPMEEVEKEKPRNCQEQ